ncbi:MAG TPA: ATP-binding cassette domain-containing protein, partial [Candidatus Limnocylindrales bacterium]
MPEPREPVIALARFGFRHVGSDRPALADVALEVRAGEYLGVLGATGAGVTTLLTALDGVVPQLVRGAASGSIAVLGRDPRMVGVAEQARQVGLVFDDPGLVATQASVADEVAFGLENLGVPRSEMDARIAAALLAVGLAGFEDRDPATLSGGELQRLAIGCALATGPTILVLDEPSANLDPAGRRSLQRVVRRLNREHGVTVVVADQDPTGIAEDATRVVVLDAGRVVADGLPADVLGSPRSLRGHGVRSTDAAVLGEALGLARPVPTGVAEVARCLARRDPAEAAGDGGADLAGDPSPSSQLLVDVRDVTYRYPRAARPAVVGVSLAAAPGEVIGIVGANGSGKTTLGRLVNGLLRPQQGRISVDGMDTAAHPVRTLAAHVGSVFQDPAQQLFASTVADELALGPRALGMSEARIGERVRELAEALQLEVLLARHPLRLARAERKLVALAAVLAMRPRVLVLDEPTTGADLRLAAVIEARIRAAAGEGTAVLVASHDMAFLGRVASRLVVMDAGRVVADGPIRSVFADV